MTARLPFEVDAGCRRQRCRGRAPRSWSISAIRNSPTIPRCCPMTASGWRAWSSSSASTSASIRWRWSSRKRSHRGKVARRDRAAGAKLRPAGGFLRREAVGGGRHDRRRLLSEAGHRPAVGFQDQRICQPDRRRRVRAQGRKSDARLPRRVALRPSGLCRGVCARMPGAARACATKWG